MVEVWEWLCSDVVWFFCVLMVDDDKYFCGVVVLCIGLFVYLGVVVFGVEVVWCVGVGFVWYVGE